MFIKVHRAAEDIFRSWGQK